MEKIIYGIIYKCTNLVNGKVYIGQTVRSLKERIKDHIQSSKNPKSVFHYAIKKYGDNFSWDIIDSAIDKEELDYKEKYWINQYKSYASTHKGYNVHEGGTGGNTFKWMDKKDYENLIERFRINNKGNTKFQDWYLSLSNEERMAHNQKRKETNKNKSLKEKKIISEKRVKGWHDTWNKKTDEEKLIINNKKRKTFEEKSKEEKLVIKKKIKEAYDKKTEEQKQEIRTKISKSLLGKSKYEGKSEQECKKIFNNYSNSAKNRKNWRQFKSAFELELIEKKKRETRMSWSEERKKEYSALLSKTRTGRKCKSWTLSKTKEEMEEFGRKRSNATKGLNNPRCVKILCVETEVIYPSIDEASNSVYFNSKYRSRIYTSLKEDRPVKGFTWKRV